MPKRAFFGRDEEADQTLDLKRKRPRRAFGADQPFFKPYTSPDIFRKLASLARIELERSENDLENSAHRGNRDRHISRNTDALTLNALRYLPHAVYKWLEHMPAPWEPTRFVPVIFHHTGALAFIEGSRRVPEVVHRAQWARWCAYLDRRRHEAHVASTSSGKRQRDLTRSFVRLQVPAFDDDEPSPSFREFVYHRTLPTPFANDADAAAEYERIQQLAANLHTPEARAALYRMSLPWAPHPNDLDPSQFYLRNRLTLRRVHRLEHERANLRRKSLHAGSLHSEGAHLFQEDWDDFTELGMHSILPGQHCAPELHQAYPYLYDAFDERTPNPEQPLWHHHAPRPLMWPPTPPPHPLWPSAWSWQPTLAPLRHSSAQGAGERIIPDTSEGASAQRTRYRAHPALGDFDLDACGERVGAWLDLLYAPRPYKGRCVRKRKRMQDIDMERELYWQLERVHYTRPKSTAAVHSLLKRRCRQAEAQRLRYLRKERGRGRKQSTLAIQSASGDAGDEAEKQHRRPDLLRTLRQSGFFYRTSMDWLEVGIWLCDAARSMFLLLLRRKRFFFLSLDYNFQIVPLRTLTTKERKQSRFGNAFHLMREWMRMVKLIVDVHLRYRAGLGADAIQLADSITYIESHIGELTGLYRYKYRVMRQIHATKDLKHLMYQRFGWSGPGKACWQPLWRQWVHLLRGLMPLLEQWLGNLLNRHFEGREPLRMAQRTVTKQRLESQFDVALRQETIARLRQLLPAARQPLYTRRVLQHMHQAWRCWKANIPWHVRDMPPEIDRLVRDYVQQRAQWWIEGARRFAIAFRSGRSMDKALVRQMYGRLARLAVHHEQAHQRQYLEHGPFLLPTEAASILYRFATYLEKAGVADSCPWQLPWFAADNADSGLAPALLQLAIERLRPETEGEHCPPGLGELVTEAEAAPAAMLYRIQQRLQAVQMRHQVELRFYDDADLTPVYRIDSFERLVDAFLDQWLWYKATETRLFPAHVQPCDDELPPVHVLRFVERLDAIPHLWTLGTGPNKSFLVLIQTPLSGLFQRADLLVLDRLLRQLLAPEIVDYLIARCNATITFKDMRYTQSVGILPGWEFSGFLQQLYGLAAVDLAFRAPDMDADLLSLPSWPPAELAGDHDVRRNDARSCPSMRLLAYERILDRLYALIRVPEETARVAVTRLEQRYERHPERETLLDAALYPSRRCWPSAVRMRLRPFDCLLGRALFDAIRDRIGPGVSALRPLVEMPESQTAVSVVSGPENPSLFFEMFGFEVRMLASGFDRILPAGMGSARPASEAAATAGMRWSLPSGRTVAYVRVSPHALQRWALDVQRLLMATIHAPFTRVAARWNALALHFAGMYRQVAANDPTVRQFVQHAQERVQNRIKLGLNSKMPVRFPPVVFYAPRSLGGLEMMNIGHDPVPSLWSFIPSWLDEIADAELLERELQERAQAFGAHLDRRLLPPAWLHRGLPRLAARYHPQGALWTLDHGYRVRSLLRVHVTGRKNALWWLDFMHDGRLWELDDYRSQVTHALGGVPAILSHTLFAATGYRDWRGIVWGDHGFEHKLAGRPLTRAQRSGLVQIPNRRFTLWWSPTINRSRVYMGFRAQLDLTGIFMYGKLSTLKISLLQVFRGHLWQRIHESLVLDLCKALDTELGARSREARVAVSVQKERIHPRKSYRMHWSSADIRIDFEQPILVSGDALPVDEAVAFESNAGGQGRSSLRPPGSDAAAKIYWIDVQLRWGDYDDHDAAQYAAQKFRAYTAPGASSLYPSHHGLVVVFDLAYGEWSAFGHACAMGVVSIVTEESRRMLMHNQALALLRERIRKALQLYVMETVESETLQAATTTTSASDTIPLFVGCGGDLWRQRLWIVDDRTAYRPHANGVIWIWETSTGRLFVKIVHRTTWAGQTRRAQLAKWKCAEHVLTMLRSQPTEELPRGIVLAQTASMDPLKTLLAGTEYAKIPVRAGAAAMPLQALMALPEIRDRTQTARSSELSIWSGYADWLEHVPVWIASARFLLLLHALDRAPERVLQLVWPQRPADEESAGSATPWLWPALPETDWRRLELELQSLVPVRLRPAHVAGDQPGGRDDDGTEQVLEHTRPKTVAAFDRYGNVISVETTTPFERQEYRTSSVTVTNAEQQRLLSLYRRLPDVLENLHVVEPGHTNGSLYGGERPEQATISAMPHLAKRFELHLPRGLVRGLLLAGMTCGQLWGTRTANADTVVWIAWALRHHDAEASTPLPSMVEAAACFRPGSVQAIGWIQACLDVGRPPAPGPGVHAPHDVQVMLYLQGEERQIDLASPSLDRHAAEAVQTHDVHASRAPSAHAFGHVIGSTHAMSRALGVLQAWTGGGSGDVNDPQSVHVRVRLRDDLSAVFLYAKDGRLIARPPGRLFETIPALIEEGT